LLIPNFGVGEKMSEQIEVTQKAPEKKNRKAIVWVILTSSLIFISCIALIVFAINSEISSRDPEAQDSQSTLELWGLWDITFESIIVSILIVFFAMLLASIPFSLFLSLISGSKRSRIKGDLWAEIENLGFNRFLKLSADFTQKIETEERDNKDASEYDVAKLFSLRFDDLYGEGSYAIPLAWLTTFYFLGWLIFFFPRAMTGGATVSFDWGDFYGFGALIQDGFVQYINNIAADANLFSFAFLGSYFWSLQILIRRYNSSDLKPQTFVTATQRVVSGWVAATVFLVALPETWLENNSSEAAFGFFLGMFTMPIVGALWDRTKALISGEGMDKLWPKNDLQELAIDPFVRQRLSEENVNSIHDLATVNLLDLLTRTRIDTQRIISWVDLALLHFYAGPDLTKKLAKVRILKASDLLDVWNNPENQNKNLLTKTELISALISIKDENPDTNETVSSQIVEAQIKGLITSLRREANIHYIYNYWQIAEKQ
jgi:hypothetical protein